MPEIIDSKIHQKRKKKEVAGTSDHVELVIHCASGDFRNTEKSGRQILDKN